jgi:hypothetical protein
MALKKSNRAGTLSGLRFRLFTNFHENLTLFNSFLSGSGLIIRISNSSYLTSYELDGIQIQSGLYTNVQIERAFKFVLPKPYSNCDLDNNDPKNGFSSFIYDLMANSEYEYTQSLCLTQCIQYFTIKECNCSDSLIFSRFPSPSCVTDEQIKCSSNFYTKNLLENGSSFQEKICFPLCPMECNRTEFRTTLSSVNLLGESFVDLIKQNENLSQDFSSTRLESSQLARESFVRLNIFYDTLSYTHSSESVKLDFLTLIAFVGGMLSLFLGLSSFSLLEVIETLIHLFLMKKSNIIK